MTYSVTHHDGRQERFSEPDRGTFGSLLQLRRERKQREAQAQRDARLVALDRSIKALELWHHEWRLRHDGDYRELHPGQWCELHGGPSRECWRQYCSRAFGFPEPRGRRTAYAEPRLTLEERRRATRNVVSWAREQTEVQR